MARPARLSFLAEKGMKPILAITGGGYLLLILATLVFSGGVHERLKAQILRDPVSFGAQLAADTLREEFPAPTPENRERMIQMLQGLTRNQALFKDCAPDHPLKVHVLDLIEKTAASALPPREEAAFFELIFFQTPEERLLFRLLTPSARKGLLDRSLSEYRGRLRDGRLPPQDHQGYAGPTRMFRVTVPAKELGSLLDEKSAPAIDVSREALLHFGLAASRGLPKFHEWIGKQVHRADPGVLHPAVQTLMGILKRAELSADPTARARLGLEVQPILVGLLTRTQDQIDSALPILLRRYDKEMPEEALLAKILAELRGEARLKLFRTILAKSFENVVLYHGADVIRWTLELGEDLSVPLYETLLLALPRWNGYGDPFEAMIAYTISHPSAHATFLKNIESGQGPLAMRTQGSIARIKLPPDDPSWGFVQTLALGFLDRQSQGAYVRDYLLLLDLSSEETRRRVADLMATNRVSRFQPQPSQAFRVARPEQVSNLYALLIGRLLERPDEHPDRSLRDTGEIKHVTVPADRAYVLECLRKTHPELVGKFPALSGPTAPAPTPRPEAPAPVVKPPTVRTPAPAPAPAPAPRTEARESQQLRLSFQQKPSPELLKEILPKVPQGPEMKALLALVLPLVENPALDETTRRAYSQAVTAPGILPSAVGLDQVRLARLASTEARQKSLRIGGDRIVTEILRLTAEQNDLFLAAIDALLLVPGSMESVPAESGVRLLSDRRVGEPAFDRLLELLIVKEPVAQPILDRIAAAKAIEGGGTGLFLKRYLGPETDLRKRMMKIDLALGPNKEQRGVHSIIKDRGIPGPDEALMIAILEDVRRSAGAYKGKADDQVRLEALTYYAGRDRLSPAVQEHLIRTFKAVPSSLPALRWDLYRATAGFTDARAITFLIQNLPEQHATWRRLVKSADPVDLVVYLAVLHTTKVSLLKQPIPDAQEWLKKNKDSLQNQYAP